MGYIAKVGLNYRDPDDPKTELRVEAGERCDDIPQKSVAWLLEQGAIEPVEDPQEPEE